ncbi:hypothetical protein ACQP25_44535 (plasmid) [Microtetraspora malaysiensis]|uniref:hypothetical protein n=1 Tax=Microtetraspora malaysiensis TaxID=161358 RepID=UPI003D8EEAE9
MTTTADINSRYVLVHDGLWMYHLGQEFAEAFARVVYSRREQITAHADGQPMTRLNAPGWWAADHEATEITITIPLSPRTIGYTLDDPAAESTRFPASLTPEQYNALNEDDDDILSRMYSPVREDVAPETVTVTGPWTPLEASTPAADGHPWHAALPSALTQRPEYLHLFPGELRGLRAHLEKLIEAMPDVRFCFNKEGRLDVTVEVPLHLPEHFWVKPSRGRKYQRQVTVTRRLSLPVPDRVPGPDRASAVRAWDEQVTHWTGVVAAASAKACNTCRGTGHVPDGSTEFDKKL